MKLVTLERLQELHFEDRSKRMRARLVSLARAGQLPGAAKLGNRWMCDLEAFKARAAANDDKPTPTSNLREMVRIERERIGAQQ